MVRVDNKIAIDVNVNPLVWTHDYGRRRGLGHTQAGNSVTSMQFMAVENWRRRTFFPPRSIGAPTLVRASAAMTSGRVLAATNNGWTNIAEA